MKITISGEPGAGKSTAAKLLAQKLHYKHYSNGDFMRDMAEERKMDFFVFIKLAEKDKSIDKEIDQRQVELGQQEDNFVIDCRLGFHFIPDSIKICMDADFDERAKRIFGDRLRNEDNATLENTKENLKMRKNNELKRYVGFYNLNPFDKRHYDFCIDTTNLTPDQVVEKILAFLEKQ